MNNFTKGQGAKIGIKFTEELVGDISGNEFAFTVEGREYKYVNGALIDGDYRVESVERYPVLKVWELGESLKLDNPGEMRITDSKCYEVASGTNLTGTVSANAGDIVLATISHRSSFTNPNGWTKLYESIAVNSSFAQRMVFAIKKIEATGQVSFTATQSSTGRIYLNLISIGGIDNIENANYEAINTTPTTIVDAPDKKEGEKLIWGCTAPLWAISNYKSWSTIPNDLQMISLPTTTQARQANFVDFGNGAVTGRKFAPDAGTGSEVVVNAVRLIREYKTPKVYITDVIQLSGQYRINWISEQSNNTNIKIEISMSGVQGSFVEVQNGDVIEFNDSLWIRVTLSTTDSNKTPILKSLWLEDASAPQNKILITMKPLSRFASVEGDLTVSYDASKGNLTGVGGAVESFQVEFAPTDLIPEPNPHIEEYITVSPSIEVDFIPIDYVNSYETENISVAPSIEIEFINVAIINP